MNIKELKEYADEGSVNQTITNDEGIVAVSFLVLGAPWKAQYDSDNSGIYAFEVTEPEAFFKALGELHLRPA
jgi:hypothetical protein